MVKRKSKVTEDTSALKLITEEEWLSREQRHLQRLQDIKICLGFIADAQNDHNALLEKHRQTERWTHYLDCDGLPRPEWPPEIRRFLSQMRYEEAQDGDELINWTLSVNERSILSQNIFRKDLTWKTLSAIRPNIGKIYDICVQRILEMVLRIDRVLENELEMVHISEERAAEMLQMRHELNEEIHVLFDKLTYRIICAPSAYMVYNDCTVADYCYKGVNYNFQMWCIKDVPIRFQHLDIPVMIANLEGLGVNLQMPFSILGDNLTLQCVHTFFDPYSEKAKSHDIEIEIDTSNISSGMVDIEDCLINEWLKQVEIQEEMIAKMETKMQQYEEAMSSLQAKEGGQLKVKEDKLAKGLRAPKQPQSLPEGMVPDPHNLFLDREEQQFIDFLNDSFHPRRLDLRSDEINLREFLILGGIFSLAFVRKPKHTDFEKFNITLHEDGRVVYIRRDVRIGNEDDDEEDDEEEHFGPLLASTSQQLARRETTRSTRSRIQLADMEANTEMKIRLNEDELPFFFITFKLPKELFLWGEPIVCQFIEEEEELIEIEEELVQPEPDKLKHRKKKNKAVSIRNTEPTTDTESGDKVIISKGKQQQQQQPNEKVEYHRPKPTVIMRMHAEPSNIYRPSVLEMLRRSTLNKELDPGTNLANFEMTGHTLNNMQLHNIQRHCVPRILSSFKLPLEFKEEYLDELSTKKVQGPMLMMRQQADKQLDEKAKGAEFFFSYEDQTAPERMYPVLRKREKILYRRNPFLRVHIFGQEDDDSDDDMEGSEGTDLNFREPTMYGVLKQLEDIEGQYTTNYKKIMDQPLFVVKKQAVKQSIDATAVSSGHDAASTTRSKSRVPTRRSKLHLLSKSGAGDTGSARNTDIMEFMPKDEMDLRDADTISLKGSTDVFRRSRKTDYVSSDNEDDDDLYASKDARCSERPKVIHWTTKYIQNTELDREHLTVTVRTDRVGLFGFAFKRYAHFPFRHWCMEPSEENANEIVFTLDTFHVRVVLYISNKGIRGYVTDLVKEYTAKPEKYMTIEEPIFDFGDFRKRFQEKNVNIFAEHDAKFYIENGYYSLKMLALELHVYDAMAIHCKMIKFFRSEWNRLATRRNIVLCLRNPKDLNEGAEVTCRVTPDNSTFVEVSELCSDDLDIFKLHYQSTWRNIGNYSDLHQLINSMYPHATDIRNRDPKLIYYIRKLLLELRPLSYS